MTNREQIEQAIISAEAFNGNDTEALLSDLDNAYKYKSMWDNLKQDYIRAYKRYRNAKEKNIIGEQHILGFLYSMDILDKRNDAEQVLHDLERGE
ncbi:DUF1024 family protein [Staphylococcus pasteuri]|nr:DUF1024 family protein [Staphylococcus pasteuri]MCD9066002.1 DUF1024 family protein [Staphylococcus pasteuri]WAE41305.1 DUF1024 family protein [Staphylococcus pasteuri]